MKDTEYIKQLALYHKGILLERTRKINDGAFSSGAAWAVYALDRVVAACDGERDLEALGLVPKTSKPVEPVQEVLFGVDDGKA